MSAKELFQDVYPNLFGRSRPRQPLPQVQRRCLVILMYGAALLTAWFLLPQRSYLATLTGYVTLLLSLWAYWQLTTCSNPETVTHQLDERQLLQTALAYRTAYNLAFVSLCLGGPYLMLATGLDWPMPRTLDDWLSVVMLGVGPLGLTLPTAVLAWTEPDVEDDE